MPRSWSINALNKIHADYRRSGDTHLYKLNIPSTPSINFYLKDESSHPTGSLKHRLARSLFLYGISNNWIKEDTAIIEASSGSTAVSEAYFADMLNLDFYAVMPRSTSKQKISEIERYGGICHFVDDPSTVYEEANRLAVNKSGHYIDQFTYAERATDWRGNNNIAESIYNQMTLEPYPIPNWIICSAGTGGTSATLGRFIRYMRHNTQLCVADPQNSVFFEYYQHRNIDIHCNESSRIEGIGRPRVEPSFIPEVVDHMEQIPDIASIAASWFLKDTVGFPCGASTGTNLIACIRIIDTMRKNSEKGSVVTLLCDGASRYEDTYFSREWLENNGFFIKPWINALMEFWHNGVWVEP